jgi:hypothetical protein
MPDDLGDARLDAGSAALGLLLEERLLLGEAEGDDGAVDGDRAALEDERLRRRVLAETVDDRGPGLEQCIQVGVLRVARCGP